MINESATTTETRPDGGELGQALFGDVVTRFINPEIERRRGVGTWPEVELVSHFQVLFHESGQVEIRLNEEIGGMAEVRATRDVKADETITTNDFDQVSKYIPREEDAGIPHVTAFSHRDGWSLIFKFAGGHPSGQDHLVRGREFMETARKALTAGHLGPFLDNAFSATELLAKAELLACRPTVDLVLNSKRHGSVATPYHAWAKLGNTEGRFAALLKTLTDLRGSARYLQRDLDIATNVAWEMMQTLDAMAAHVLEVLGDEVGGGAPSQFNVYATRDIDAGHLVTAADSTIYPPKN